jgi:hypothetical protein
MAKLNILTHINIYQDPSITNNPSQNNVRWTNDLQGVEVTDPESKTVNINGMQKETLFSGVIETSVDNTTTFDLVKKSGVSNTYILKHNSGTAPQFREGRDIQTDDTSQVTITKSGSLLTFTASGGALFDTSDIEFGDTVRIGNVFNMFNVGVFKILSKTSDSFTIENIIGVAETVVLGTDYEKQLSIYSSDGVQIGQNLKITANFSQYSRDIYEITDVGIDYLELHTTKGLPEELDVQAEVVVYKDSKGFIYIECDKPCSIIIDGIDQGQVKPLTFGTKKKIGIFMRTGFMYSAEIKNNSTDVATITVITAE